MKKRVAERLLVFF